jgi:hypothetical protein
MANTVNDVMNVIASPDYGIKNIAGTNQEILAILEGTHKSKNNIHNIVDDIKILLQKLVKVSTNRKHIEINTSVSKINQKNIESLLDETKGIRTAIEDLSVKLEKHSGATAVAKLSDKASNKVADAMIKNIEKQKSGSGLAPIVDAFNKLKNISLKDIIFGNQKVKLISKIFKNAQKDLKIDDKDLNAIIKLINASPEMIKSLSKISRKINKIIKNDIIKKLSDILVGKGSLLTLSKALQKNAKLFEEANKISNNLKDLTSSLNKAMMKLFFASIWSKLASNAINNITIVVNKLIPLSKFLVKNKEVIDTGSKVAKNMATLVGNLLISSLYLALSLITVGPAMLGAKLLAKIVDSIIPAAKLLEKNKGVIDKGTKVAKNMAALVGNLLLSSLYLAFTAITAGPAMLGAYVLVKVVDNIIPIAVLLEKNKSVIDKGTKVAKNITALVGNLLISSIYLTIAAFFAIPAIFGAMVLSVVVDEFIPIANKISKNSKEIEKSAKVAKDISAISGNLLLSTIFLTIAAFTGIPAIFGAMVLSVVVDQFMPIVKKLSKNNKHISKAVASSIGVIVITGLMTLTSYMLYKIGEIGIQAIFGSLLLYGIVQINIVTFKALGKAFSTIVKGAISMAIMSISLILFGVALNLITKATKDVTFKQVAIIASLTVILAGAVVALGIPVVFGFIMLGSIAMGVMGVALMPFAITLGMMAKATKGMKFKDILLITTSMLTLAGGISALAFLLIPVTLGAITLAAVNAPLSTFVKTLKIVDEMGTVPTKQVKEVLTAMDMVAKFFRKNALKFSTVWNARRYGKIMWPFLYAVIPLSKLSKINEIPINLVVGVLMAMRLIGLHFTYFPISRGTIRQANRYKEMMRPFVNTVYNLSKLKKLGTLPISLVTQTLEAMYEIANYYDENSIGLSLIWQANLYKKMLKPFGNTLQYFVELKKMGTLPMSLVHQTLDAMSEIANYYDTNSISIFTIWEARRYMEMLEPYGTTVKSLAELKKMGTLPMSLIYQTLDIISEISNFYKGQDMGFFEALTANSNASFISNIVNSFGKAVESLKSLKEMRYIPSETLKQTLIAISSIAFFYKYVEFDDEDDIEDKSDLTKLVVSKFSEMSGEIQEKLANVRTINDNGVKSIVRACQYIIRYYTYSKFFVTRRKIINMNECVKLFLENVDEIQKSTQNFASSNYINVKNAVKSMREILVFLRKYSLNALQRRIARKNITLLSLMSSTMSGLSNINPLHISSIGDSLTNALSGVESVDISRVTAVTDMFNAFNGINKSESIIDKFTESVNGFTTACQRLMDAMGHNTDAINGMELGAVRDPLTNEIISNGGSAVASSNISSQNGGVRIINVDEIARTIAEQINGVLSVDVPDTQVQLLINGSGGNEWTISRY